MEEAQRTGRDPSKPLAPSAWLILEQRLADYVRVGGSNPSAPMLTMNERGDITRLPC
jgi:hypothetical protein